MLTQFLDAKTPRQKTKQQHPMQQRQHHRIAIRQRRGALAAFRTGPRHRAKHLFAAQAVATGLLTFSRRRLAAKPSSRSGSFTTFPYAGPNLPCNTA
jgi:hypothetical protein